ncbi:MAG: hypothetical protein KC621_27495 [Myxococcales bacterium]|nr:hypothetical protein [Myxococcales bacterium]
MALLPQDDPNQAARAAGLTEAKDEYRWDHEYLAPLPMLSIPRLVKHDGIEEFLLAGLTELPPLERPDDDMPAERLEATTPGLITARFDEGLFPGDARYTEVTDYLKLLRGLGQSHNVAGSRSYEEDWDSDAAFAWQRIAGPNPMTIERPDAARWAKVQARLGLTDEVVRRGTGDASATVEGLLSSGRLLVSDYAMIVDPEPLPMGTTQGVTKRLPAPIGVFTWDDARNQLLPIAIRRGQTREAPLVGRDGSAAWSIAKAELAAADFDWHEMGVHLMGVHFLMEGIIVAARRSLPAIHPVMTLLAPHFKYHLLNNFAGRELLVEPGGYVEQILAGDLAKGSLGLVKRAYERFHFDDLDVPKALAARNLVNRSGLPIFPYRDDGMHLWSIIDTWSRSYVAAYYRDDTAVAKDVDLERWCRETTSADGAHLAGFPERLETRDALASTLTRLIFLAGPQHAAVNYAQQASMTVVPNMPGAAWSDDPSTLLEMLPPVKTAHTQVEAIWLLTCYQYGRLGQYKRALTDPQVHAPLQTFQAQLREAETLFIGRDTTDRAGRAYPYLRPSRVPNSANI